MKKTTLLARYRAHASAVLFAAICIFGIGSDSFDASAQERSVRRSRASVPEAAVLTITPITWGVVGLDSNNVNVGPNLFPAGARVCNTGDAPATNVSSNFVWDSANALINLRSGSGSSLSLASLAAGACTDFYYDVEVTRSAAAYHTTRQFRITAAADGLGAVSTPLPREIYIEQLISQNRNSVTGIKLNGVGVPFGGTMNLTVGGTYTIQLTGSTATNGYEQISTFITLPNMIFQILNVASTYSAPSGYTSDKLYEDACGWIPDPINVNYRSCLGTGKTGGAVTLTYTVKILAGAGTSQPLNTLIHDFSGSSYHYNSDFSSSAVVANISAPLTAATASVSGRVVTSGGRGIANAMVSLYGSDGSVRTMSTGRRGAYRFDEVEDGQTYVVSVASRRFSFVEAVRVVFVTDNVSGVDFVAER